MVSKTIFLLFLLGSATFTLAARRPRKDQVGVATEDNVATSSILDDIKASPLQQQPGQARNGNNNDGVSSVVKSSDQSLNDDEPTNPISSPVVGPSKKDSSSSNNSNDGAETTLIRDKISISKDQEFKPQLKQDISDLIGGGAIEGCDPDMITYEINTGYVFSAPGKLLDSLPGTLMLTDCLEACHNNASCRSVNYETGLCVLFSSNADNLPGALSKSQFPVFTIYAQKVCLGVKGCSRSWTFDRVQGYRLNGYAKKTINVNNRRDCLEMCLGEVEFTCRSANYHSASQACELSEMDRITLAGTGSFMNSDGVDYLENNCVEEPTKLCEFRRLSGRILKTVDSVYQDVSSIDECRDLCLTSPYRCHSYDYGDTGDMVCRLSHHSRATLSDVQDPYLEVPEAATYELSSCYNVSIECGAVDMIARIRTSKLFNGKVYAKGAPKSCSIDVKNALDFELRMSYNDLECNVRQQGNGRYINDVIIQHHDMIITSSDLGLAVTCQYDLANKTVATDADLGVRGEIEPAISEEVIVESPNVVMRITSRDGSDVMRSAEVGDPLALKFEIIDELSPFEIMVRELVAMDGTDNSEITLIDSRGCPTDHFIMGPIYKSSISGKVLLSHFDAFKFPTSEVVQFRALVTPCMPSCEPVQCDQEDSSGELKSLISFGRRRRDLNGTLFEGAFEDEIQRYRRDVDANPSKKASQDDLLLVQSIQITDKFGFEKHQQTKPTDGFETNDTIFMSSDNQGFCVNAIGLIVAGTVFLLAQLAVISIWTYLYQRRRKQNAYASEGFTSTSSFSGMSSVAASAPHMSNSRTDSMCKLYDNNGYQGSRRQF